MKILFVALLLISSISEASTLLMIGGGTRPAEAMKAFVNAAGGEQAQILVCSWASVNTDSAKNIQIELSQSHPASITVAPTFPMNAESEAKLIELLKTSTGIFFTGGDQNQLMSAISGLHLKNVFKKMYAQGTVFGGTSAGTAVMSERMITGDATSPSKTPPLAEGLGLLPSEIIVDQHFIARNRFNRLASLVLANENTIGVGIDEGTALMVTDNHTARVIGPSQVIHFLRASNSMDVKYFNPNDTFDLLNE